MYNIAIINHRVYYVISENHDSDYNNMVGYLAIVYLLVGIR